MKLSLNLFRRPRLALIALKRAWYVHVYGMDLHPTCTFSLKAKFDRTHPRGVHIGRESYVALDAIIFAHDMTRGLRADTFIGERCFIGARSIVMAGVRIGDQCIVAAGSVVVRDVPPNSIAAGNPAKVVRDGIRTTRGGCLEGAGYLAHDPAGWLTEFRDQ
ncbi:MAG: acyltransferase [Alphaproteobacteria bacterium]|nr:acyltransferase [Alphaproteobacteria bacterium]